MERSALLLDDEVEISEEDFRERTIIAEELGNMPDDFFAKLRHFQPQIGCLNGCSICSKLAGSTVAFWNRRRIRNVAAALKSVCRRYREKKPYIVWDRQEHRNGVIFSYLDNDIGNYYYLDDFIKIAYDELGVQTRISTVGYSRHNQRLNDMHIRINSEPMLDCLAGVRLSFTPYAVGWQSGCGFSREEYVEDMANFLKIYRPYYDKAGSGSRQMCVELRYKPLAVPSEVTVEKDDGHTVITAGNYRYLSLRKDIIWKESKIADAYDHTIKLTEKAELFYEIDPAAPIDREKPVEVYLFKNAEGSYFAVNPSITNNGNYGINIYPKTDRREQSGYLITERFFLNALIGYKSDLGMNSMDSFEKATWEDVENVINRCENNAYRYQVAHKEEKASYITGELLPMIRAYAKALKLASYSPKDFFDPDFTIDTGVICNMGRALKEFCGLTKKVNEPITPTQERNYGNYNSMMTKECVAWRLSCNYQDELLIEKLNLKDTASECGQIAVQKKIKLKEMDERLGIADLSVDYLVPGQEKHSCSNCNT